MDMQPILRADCFTNNQLAINLPNSRLLALADFAAISALDTSLQLVQTIRYETLLDRFSDLLILHLKPEHEVIQSI